MNPIKVTIQATGTGNCALTGRETDGLTVAFENEPACFLSWKALRQLVALKTQGGKLPTPVLLNAVPPVAATK